MKILVTGCCGYIGSLLVPFLLADKHDVTGVDIQMFGDGYLPKDNGHFRLQEDWDGEFDAVIHLAGLTSDAACQLNPEYANKMNVEYLQVTLHKAKASGIKRFIYVSSAAVYGSTTTPAYETDALEPTTIYGKHKAQCEDLIHKHESKDFKWVILRPAGACGFSPRMRFDLTVNRMTRDAVMTGKINVHGGNQVRPNIHIRDFVDCLRWALDSYTGTYNVACENATVMSVAQRVAEITGASIDVTPRTDDRSYSVNSVKISRAGFSPIYTVENAINDMKSRFKVYWPDAMTNPVYMNVYTPT